MLVSFFKLLHNNLLSIFNICQTTYFLSSNIHTPTKETYFDQILQIIGKERFINGGSDPNNFLKWLLLININLSSKSYYHNIRINVIYFLNVFAEAQNQFRFDFE